MARRISLLLLIDTVSVDAGTEKQVIELARRTDRNRFNVHLACLEDSARLRELSSCCTTAVFPTQSLFHWNGARQIYRLRRYIRQNHIDVVHAFMIKSAILGVLASRHSGCRAVITSRRNAGYWFTPFYRRIFRYLNRYTTRVLANSEAGKRWAVQAEGLPSERVDVLYNGVDAGEFSPKREKTTPVQWNIPESALVVGIVANLRPVKDLPLFLRAAALVAERIPEAAFLVVGKGPLRQELASLAGELGIRDRVFFNDGRDSVPDCLARLDVGCLSSQSEGFSNAILEYMAAGLPVVATDVGGNAEAIVEGVTGFLVRERTPAAFAAPIVKLLSDHSLRAAMGRQALERCRMVFDIAVAVRQHEDYWAGLAS